MSLDQFNAYFDTVYRQIIAECDDFDIRDIRNRTIRSLDALGHCEFDFDKRYVTACESAVVALPYGGVARAILTGARTDGLVKRIKTFEKDHQNEISIQQFQHYISNGAGTSSEMIKFPLPDAVLLEAVDVSVLNELVAFTRINRLLRYSPTFALSHFSASMDDVKESATGEIFAEPEWPSRSFDIGRLSFVKSKSAHDKPSLMTYTSPIDQNRLHIYWNENRGYEIDRDWGRYLVLSKNNVEVVLYDKRRQALAVPSTVPLPRLLARAATLCSGMVAISTRLAGRKIGGIPQNHPIEVYSAVPYHIARMIAEKLGQELTAYKVDMRIFGE
jgi:hypothetical protein